MVGEESEESFSFVQEAVQVSPEYHESVIRANADSSGGSRSPRRSSSTLSPSSSSYQRRWNNEKTAFEQAKAYLRPGFLYRWITHLYTERKVLVLLLVHFMATIIVWGHYGFLKFAALGKTVPQDASFYWLRRLGPTLAFGSKHAILFQMALIPLTMCRYSIASAAMSNSVLSRVVPFNRVIDMHIHLGYTMIALVFLATFLFCIHDGILCSAVGDQTFCTRLQSEIMITGYVISFLLLVVGATTYFRHKFPYEVFYRVHHLVLAMYVITIVHTLDKVHRSNQRERYQTFAWFSTTLLLYVCDRAAMSLSHRYKSELVSGSAISGSSSKTVIIKIRRPVLFLFQPGQYAFLRLPEIDPNEWHPFSIASGPAANYLEFRIEVFGEKSWTMKLWRLLDGLSGQDGANPRRIEFDLMGPCGASLGRTEDYSHAVAIGSGTGIVPILSLLRQHVRQLVHLDPQAYKMQLDKQRKKLAKVEHALAAQKGSLASKAVSFVGTRTCDRLDPAEADRLLNTTRRDSVKKAILRSLEKYEVTQVVAPPDAGSRALDLAACEMKQAAFQATRSIYGVVLLAVLTVFGVSLIACTLSWNCLAATTTTDDFVFPRGMVSFLQVSTIIFQLIFASLVVFVWDANQFLTYTDVAICLVAPCADWYWSLCVEHNMQVSDSGPSCLFLPRQLVAYCALMGYMTLRMWSMTVKPRHSAYQKSLASSGCGSDNGVLQRLDVIWVTRSASQVAEIFPDLLQVYDGLVQLWGGSDRENGSRSYEAIDKVCRITIHVTDKDKTSNDLLRMQLENTSLFRRGCISFERPDFAKILERHTLDLICSHRNSHTLLAFCGSPVLSSMIHQDCKIQNDMVTAMTGNKKHVMEFASESYGGVRPAAKKKTNNRSGNAAANVRSSRPAPQPDSVSATLRPRMEQESSQPEQVKGANLQQANERERRRQRLTTRHSYHYSDGIDLSSSMFLGN